QILDQLEGGERPKLQIRVLAYVDRIVVCREQPLVSAAPRQAAARGAKPQEAGGSVGAHDVGPAEARRLKQRRAAQRDVRRQTLLCDVRSSQARDAARPADLALNGRREHMPLCLLIAVREQPWRQPGG